jgi:AcrR family transcriptional regulator
MRTRDIEKVQLVREKAMEMVVRTGLEGFSMNKLAKVCDISVATLYIYYKDKEDLIIRIAIEEFERMSEATLKDFDPDMHFEEGLRFQWKVRARYMMDNPVSSLFFEQLRGSKYEFKAFEDSINAFRETMGRFVKNAVVRGEINPLPIEVFWSVAYAPLYALVRFHNEGTSIGGRPFVLNNKLLWAAFDLVIKALKK